MTPTPEEQPKQSPPRPAPWTPLSLLRSWWGSSNPPPGNFADVRRRMAQGIGWNLVAASSGQGTSLAMAILGAHLLGREDFGNFAMIQNTLLTIAGIALMAVGTFTTKYIAEFRISDQRRAGQILGLGSLVASSMAVVLAAALLFYSREIAASVLNSPALAFGLAMGAGFLIFATINGYQMAAFAGLEAYRELALAGLGSGVLMLAVFAAFTWRLNLSGAFIGLAAGACLRWAIHRWMLRLKCSDVGIQPTYRGLREHSGVLHRFALPASLGGYVSISVLWLANVILFRQAGGAAEMALYGAATTLRLLVLFLPNVINGASLSILNNLRGGNDTSRYLRVYGKNVGMIFGSALLGAMLIAVAARPALRLFGPGFEEGTTVLLVLLLSTVFESLAIALYQLIQAEERMWLSFWAISLPRGILLVSITLMLAPIQGSLGLATAYTLSWVYSAVAIGWIVVRLQRSARLTNTDSRIAQATLP